LLEEGIGGRRGWEDEWKEGRNGWRREN